MLRRIKSEENHDTERWLVSYADFITLLFAFFVVMYSLSTVNEGKYRILSESLQAAFEGPQKSLAPIQAGEIVRSPVELPAAIRNTAGVVDMEYILESMRNQGQYLQAKKKLKIMAADIEQAMAPLIKEDVVSVRNNGLWVEVDIKTSLLFPSGSADLSPISEPVLQKIAKIVKSYPNRIQVEGFTDNVPINTPVYPSNWELSAARSARVVRILSQDGVKPSRMVAMGYAEFRPKSDNSTEEGRTQNRRVVLTILAELEIPRGLSDKTVRELSPSVTSAPKTNTGTKVISLVESR